MRLSSIYGLRGDDAKQEVMKIFVIDMMDVKDIRMGGIC